MIGQQPYKVLQISVAVADSIFVSTVLGIVHVCCQDISFYHVMVGFQPVVRRDFSLKRSNQNRIEGYLVSHVSD